MDSLIPFSLWIDFKFGKLSDGLPVSSTVVIMFNPLHSSTKPAFDILLEFCLGVRPRGVKQGLA